MSNLDEERELLATARFRVVEVTRLGPDGSAISKSVVRHPGAVAVIPLLDGDRICLIRNQRLSVGRSLIEIPAGTLEPGESPEETARRELAEETGFVATRMEFLQAFFPSPGVLDERMHVYVATGLLPGTQRLEADERITNLIVSWEQALKWIDEGRIEDGKTIASLLMWDRRRRTGSQ